MSYDSWPDSWDEVESCAFAVGAIVLVVVFGVGYEVGRWLG